MSKSPIIHPKEMPKILTEFLTHDEVRSQEFWKHFGQRKASREIPVPDLHECIDKSIHYDHNHHIEARLLETVVFPEDRQLFQDVAKFVFEDFINEPKSVLTLKQFKAQLARRMMQVGF